MTRRERTGTEVASILAGSWRPSPPAVHFPESTVIATRTILLHTGAAGLAWWRIRGSPLKDLPSSQELHEAHRHYAIGAAARELRLARIFLTLRDHGIEPILAKGWAIAREYPQVGLRPYGDFDICVPAERRDETARICDRYSLADVDIHVTFRELESPYELLLKQSVEVPLGDSTIRILCPEDHFRLLAIHTLFHGAWKPIWLCDIALLLEATGERIDWERVLSGDPKRSEWVLAAIALAHHVLGAQLPEELSLLANRKFPRWLYQGLLEQWSKADSYMTGPGALALLQEGRLIELIRSRWPNPIQATIETNARISRTPRLGIQLADILKRISDLRN